MGVTPDVAEAAPSTASAKVFSADVVRDCGGDESSAVIAAAEAGSAHTEVLSRVDTTERRPAAVKDTVAGNLHLPAPKPVRRRDYQ